MTDREKAIVMAYTGYTMLTGDKLGLYYQYIAEKLGRPVMTHELCEKPMQESIRTLSKLDFIELCMASDEPRVMTPQDFDGNPMKDQYGNLPCWLESRHPLVASNWCRWNEDDFIRPIMMLNFRPWTSRPTEEQRKAVKWDD